MAVSAPNPAGIKLGRRSDDCFGVSHLSLMLETHKYGMAPVLVGLKSLVPIKMRVWCGRRRAVARDKGLKESNQVDGMVVVGEIEVGAGEAVSGWRMGEPSRAMDVFGFEGEGGEEGRGGQGGDDL